jgi:hypothetical protein
MTKLKPEQSLIRETAAQERLRPLVVELHPHYLAIRVKGTHERVTVNYGAVLDLGRKLDARERMAARQAEAAARRA